MMLFDFCINFIESVLFSYFIANYFNLKNKKSYFIITVLGQLLLLMVANFIGNSGLWLSICIIIFMIASIIIWTRKIDFDYLYMVLLYNSLIIILSLIGRYFTNTLFMMFNIFDEQLFHVCLCVFVKMFQVILTTFFLKKGVYLSTSLNLKDWGFVLALDVVILSSLIVSGYSFVCWEFNDKIMGLMLILSFLSAFFYRYTIYRIDCLNKEKVQFARIEEITKANQQKLLMMSQIRYEITSTDHRMLYLLTQMQNYIDNQEYDKLNASLKNYINLMSKHKLVSDTKNVIFDCMFSFKINEMILNGKNIENTIFMSQKDVYNEVEFIDFILKLLDFFDECSTLFISMQEVSSILVIKIVYRDGNIYESELEKFLLKNTTQNMTWKISDHETKGIRISIDMDNYL